MHETDQNTDHATWVTPDEAAWIAGVSMHTIGHWIQRGWLSSVLRRGDRLISMADIPTACAAAAQERWVLRQAPAAGVTGQWSDTNIDIPPPIPESDGEQLRAMLMLIRDEWIEPYVARIAELSRLQGRLEAQRNAARRRVRAIERAQDTARCQ